MAGLPFTRRTMIGSAAAALLLAGKANAMDELDPQAELYGMIGQIRAVPGKRAELVRYLTAGAQEMPGNLAYLVATDRADADAVWITEVWTSAEAHRASLDLPQVQEAIRQARPIIAGFGTRAEVTPVRSDGA